MIMQRCIAFLAWAIAANANFEPGCSSNRRLSDGSCIEQRVSKAIMMLQSSDVATAGRLDRGIPVSSSYDYDRGFDEGLQRQWGDDTEDVAIEAILQNSSDESDLVSERDGEPPTSPIFAAMLKAIDSQRSVLNLLGGAIICLLVFVSFLPNDVLFSEPTATDRLVELYSTYPGRAILYLLATSMMFGFASGGETTLTIFQESAKQQLHASNVFM